MLFLGKTSAHLLVFLFIWFINKVLLGFSRLIFYIGRLYFFLLHVYCLGWSFSVKYLVCTIYALIVSVYLDWVNYCVKYAVQCAVFWGWCFQWPFTVLSSPQYADTVWHKCCKFHWQRRYNRLFRANPTDKSASQWSSEQEARSSTGSNICQLDLQGIDSYRPLPVRFATLKTINGVGGTIICIRLNNLWRTNIKGRPNNCPSNTVAWQDQTRQSRP